MDVHHVPLVASTPAYALPPRCAASALMSLRFVDSNGDDQGELEPTEVVTLERFNDAADPPTGYYFRDNQIVLVPPPSSSATGSLRMFYVRRPSSLTNTSGATSTVSSTTASVITCGAVNTGTLTSSTYIDLTEAAPPYRLLAKDLALTASDATTVTICAAWASSTSYSVGNQRRTSTGIYECVTAGTSGSTGPTRTTPGLDTDGTAVWRFLSLPLTSILTAGDFVTVRRTSYVPHIPHEWHSLLVLCTAARILGNLGDKRKGEIMAEIGQMKRDLQSLSTPRGNTRMLKPAVGWGAY